MLQKESSARLVLHWKPSAGMPATKRETALRLMRGEPADDLSCEVGTDKIYCLEDNSRRLSRVLKPLSRLVEGDATDGEILKVNEPLREKARRLHPLGFRRSKKSNSTTSTATGKPYGSSASANPGKCLALSST